MIKISSLILFIFSIILHSNNILRYESSDEYLRSIQMYRIITTRRSRDEAYTSLLEESDNISGIELDNDVDFDLDN